MPALKNAKHELFARSLASGKSATEAMQDAGYSDPRNSTRLTKNDEIRRRVDEIKSRAAEKAEWTVADRLRMLEEIAMSSKGEDPRVSISAIAETNKMQGSYAPAKLQHSGRIATIDVAKLKGMTDEELELLERALVQIGIADGDPNREGGEEV